VEVRPHNPHMPQTGRIPADVLIFPVPTIVLVTKGDGLVTKYYDELRSRADPVSVREARKLAASMADEQFKNKIIPQLMSAEHPPAQCVFVKSKASINGHLFVCFKFYPMTDMHKTDSNCAEIVEKMAEAITNDALQVLFVSTQKNNLELCTKYAIKKWVFWCC